MSDVGGKSGPIFLSTVLAEEYNKLPHAGPDAPVAEANECEAARLKEVYKSIHRVTPNRSALCLSGGGIRSATFGLGVLQVLAQQGLLGKFDYLSTVSGGGYIGSWLTAWIRRDGLEAVVKGLAKSLPPSFDPKAEQEDPKAGTDKLAKGPSSPLDSEAAPIHWIRAYSNYLSPKLGLFSGDVWTLIGTYVRNVTLNWLILVPLLAALLLIPRIYIGLVELSVQPKFQCALLGFALFLGLIGLTYAHLYRPSLVADPSQANPSFLRLLYQRLKWAESPTLFTCCCLSPLILAALLLTIDWAWYVNTWPKEMVPSVDLFLESRLPTWSRFGIVAACLHLASWILSGCWLFYEKNGRDVAAPSTSNSTPTPMYRNPGWLLTELCVVGSSGFIGGTFLWCALSPSLFSARVADFAEWYAWIAPPLVIGIFLSAATLFIGLSSQYTREEDREWWGRAGSWMLASGFAWLALAGIVIAVPLLIEHVPRFIGSVGGLSGLLALYLGFSAKTQGKENNGTSQNPGEVALALLPKISAPICVVLLLGLLSLGTSSLLEHLSLSVRLTMDDSIGRWDVKGVGMPDLPSAHPYVLHATSLVLLLVIFGCSLVLSMVMAYVVNINTFSLHALYRNRLVRAYLGASHAPREANAFTKFDPADNFEIKDLIQKPFHIINATLNLVSSDNIAWQERKACSFTMSPLHCGSAAHTSSGQLGYRSSTVYGKQKAGAGGKPMTLGTALAISGAAASPNMGYHSSAPVAFLLTLFNIRLGWWLGNPGKAGEKKTITKASAQWERQKAYQVSCPGFALFPLLAEAFGFTDSDHPYVYLSDGGHFENLGLYEMVLRRCRYIVVVDAGCDPEHHFEDLGNAIRKIRIDLGIEVTISKEKNLENLELRPEKQRVVLPYAVGTIGYRKVDEHGKDGTFLYLKPSLTLTDEQPADVLQYHAKHRTFPHESTSDQFFSESQFESYRKLGEYITNVALNDGNKHPDSDLGRLVQALKTKDA